MAISLLSEKAAVSADAASSRVDLHDLVKYIA